MSVVNKFIDSVSFLTANAVYDDVNLTIKSADGFYQFGGQYRQQLSGLLLSSNVCADCFTFDSLDYVSTVSQDLCCLTQTSVQYYYPNGLNFLNTTNIFTDVNLTTIAPDGFYGEPAGNQYRQMTGSVLAAVASCSACYSAVNLEFNVTSANDLCCVSRVTSSYFVDYGSSLSTTSNVYTDTSGTVAAAGFYRTPGTTSYRQITGSTLGSLSVCPSCGAANTSFFVTAGTSTLADGMCGINTSQLLYHNGSGTLPQVGDIIYSGSSPGSSTVTWSNYRGIGPSDVGGGATESATVNASGAVLLIAICP